MKFTSGRLARKRRDPILADIRKAAEGGYFDRRRAQGSSQLESMSVFELQEAVALMGGEERRLYLARIGRFPHGRASLSGMRRKGRRGQRVRLFVRKEGEVSP